MKRLVFATLVIAIISAITEAKYSGGSGEPNNPYQIANVADLLTLAADINDYNKCFIMTADIDLDPNLPGNKIFSAAVISANDDGTVFSGVFNGAGHKIFNMTIFGNNHLGLFWRVEDGEIKNLGLENVRITGGYNSYRIGALAGYNFNSSISNCYSTGTVTGGHISFNIGGLVGYNFVGRPVSNCYSTTLVAVGDNSYEIGGLVGKNYSNISNCYSTGVVTSGDNPSYIGGLIGRKIMGSITSCYFLVTSGPDNGFGTPLTDAQMKQQSSFVDWNFIKVWFINNGVNYPQLRWLAKYSSGSGTADDPYQIATTADLLNLGLDTSDYDKHFILTRDIDLDPNLPEGQVFTTAVIAPDTDNTNWDFDGNDFTGVFDGMGHKILNLTINSNGTSSSFLGLFGAIKGGEIKNLGIENVSIISGDESDYLGALAGSTYYNSINGCYSTGTITAGTDSDNLGGLVGWNGGNINNCHSTVDVNGGYYSYWLSGLTGVNNDGNIIYCFSTGTVKGGDESWYLGGLVGGNWSGNISNCYSTGAVLGKDDTSYIGGLVGDNWNGAISNCFSIGRVTCGDNSNSVGGLSGENNGGNIINCYSTGNTTDGNNSENIGGLVGDNYNDGIITSCYFIGTNGPDNGLGTSLTDELMKQQSSFIDWDFSNVWHICEGTNYPKLIWQILPADFLCPDGVDFIDFSLFSTHWMQTDYGDCNGIELNGNGKIDLGEFAVLSNWWGQTDCGNCGGADYSGDGNVDLADIEILCDNWLATDYGIVDIEDLCIFCNYWLEGL